MRTPSIFPKHGGKPCPNDMMEISNCEKEGFADNSVPDCDKKVTSKLIDNFFKFLD